MARYATVAASPVVRKRAPLLAHAAGVVGSIHIRNRGTVGGAVAHADPVGDVPTALLTLDAVYHSRTRDRATAHAAADFSTGLFATRLQEDELLGSIEVPAQPTGSVFGYERFSVREGEYPMVVAACRLVIDDGNVVSARVAVGGADSHPKRLESLEAALGGRSAESGFAKGDLADVVGADLNPMADIRGGEEWRRKVALATIGRAVENAFSETNGGGG